MTDIRVVSWLLMDMYLRLNMIRSYQGHRYIPQLPRTWTRWRNVVEGVLALLPIRVGPGALLSCHVSCTPLISCQLLWRARGWQF